MFVEFLSRNGGHFPGARVKLDPTRAQQLIGRGVCKEIDSLDPPKPKKKATKKKAADDTTIEDNDQQRYGSAAN